MNHPGAPRGGMTLGAPRPQEEPQLAAGGQTLSSPQEEAAHGLGDAGAVPGCQGDARSAVADAGCQWRLSEDQELRLISEIYCPYFLFTV